MKKIFLFSLIAWLAICKNGFSQVKIEKIDLTQAPYSLNKEHTIYNFALDKEGNPVFAVAKIIQSSTSVMSGPGIGVIKKVGDTYNSYFLPYIFGSPYVDTRTDEPQHIEVDKEGNILLAFAYSYYSLSNENRWKSFVRMPDYQVDKLKREFPKEAIVALPYAWVDRNISFDGNAFVAPSYRYDSYLGNNGSSSPTWSYDERDEYSMVIGAASGQKVVKSIFTPKRISFSPGNGFSTNTDLKFLPQPEAIFTTSNDKIWIIYQSSFNGKVLGEKLANTIKIHKISEFEDNEPVILEGNGGVWICDKNHKNIISFYNGIGFKQYKITQDDSDNAYKYGDFRCDKGGNLFLLNLNAITKMNVDGKVTMIDLKNQTVSKLIRIDNSRSIIWVLGSNMKSLIKITL